MYNLYHDVNTQINCDCLCFVFSGSVSLSANLPEDKPSKIVDCLEVVSYSGKEFLFLFLLLL